MSLICIVEDDASVRELIRYTLSSAGFAAETFETGEAFLDYYGENREKPQLVLLDIMLPGMDGFTVFKKMQGMGCGVPVIFLTAKNAEIDKVTGLDMGADDYIAKPFGVLELIARVKAALRRGAKDVRDTLESGAIRLDTAARHVHVDGKKTELTYKEFEMLSLLMRNEGNVLTRDQFLSSIWGVDAQIETRTVDMHIKTLRTKLGAAGKAIKTVRNVGYQFAPAEEG